MDQDLGQRLTTLFGAQDENTIPRLDPTAVITVDNYAGTAFSATAQTPAEAADVLRLFASQSGIFTRAAHFDAPSPVTLKIRQGQAVTAAQKTQSTHSYRPYGLVMTFRDPEAPSWVRTATRFGSERGPDLGQVIDVLSCAGRDWGQVDFMYRPTHTGHLRLVR